MKGLRLELDYDCRTRKDLTDGSLTVKTLRYLTDGSLTVKALRYSLENTEEEEDGYWRRPIQPSI